MKKFVYSAIIFTLTLSSIFGQIEQDKSLSFFVKFHPLALVNIDRPSIQGSIELLQKKLGLEFTYGKRCYDYGWKGGNVDVPTVKFNGENFRVDLKWYDLIHRQKNKKIQFRNYIGLLYRFINDLFNAQLDYWPNDSSNTLLNDRYAVKRKIHVFAIQYGWTFTKNRFGCEANASLGVRYRIQTLLNNEFNPETSSAPNPNGYSPSNGYLPHFNICVKGFIKF